MMADYKLTDNGVVRASDGASIPSAAGNKDWEEYQVWAGGNTADAADAVDLWDAGRARRNRLLASTDYTQLPDTALSGGEVATYATYRQDLRDLPATFPDFNTVTWPTAP